jgi:hypothetical protein
MECRSLQRGVRHRGCVEDVSLGCYHGNSYRALFEDTLEAGRKALLIRMDERESLDGTSSSCVHQSFSHRKSCYCASILFNDSRVLATRYNVSPNHFSQSLTHCSSRASRTSCPRKLCINTQNMHYTEWTIEPVRSHVRKHRRLNPDKIPLHTTLPLSLRTSVSINFHCMTDRLLPVGSRAF